MAQASKIAEVLNQTGALVVMPTDTVYGVVARAADLSAVKRLYSLKKRQSKPGTLLAYDIEQLTTLGLTRRYLKAVEQFWPGAVSVIVPCSQKDLDYLTQGVGSLAVRIPDDQAVLDVLKLSGPLLTSSANLANQPPAVNLGEARAYFGELVDAYFDGGDLSQRLPSTIIRVIDDAIEVVRQGSVIIPGI